MGYLGRDNLLLEFIEELVEDQNNDKLTKKWRRNGYETMGIQD